MIGLDKVVGSVAGAMSQAGTSPQPAAPFSGVLHALVEQTTALERQG